MPTPNNIKQKALRARSLFKKRDFANAAALYTELCREAPDAESYYMLASIHGLSENHHAAEQCASLALRLNPGYDLAWNQLGIAQSAQGKYEAAKESFKKAVEINPENTQALNNLGNLCREFGDFTGAESCYRKSMEVDRKNPVTLNNLANIYLTQCLYDKAEAYYKRAIKLKKDYFDAYYNLGATYQSKGDHKQAIQYYKRAQKIRPEDINPRSAIASSYEKQGKYDKALEIIKPLIDRNLITPDIADIYGKVCIKNKSYDDAIMVIKKCLTQQLNPIHEQALHFSLGDIYDKKQSYDNAFAEYKTANTMRPYQYDRAQTEAGFNYVKTVFNETDAEKPADSGELTNIPIFIVGMPRSGTSLIEQILSSHSEVCGAGELPYLGEIAEQPFPDNKNLRYPECIRHLTKETVSRLSESYLARLKKHADSEYRHITDKMPHNFLYIGLIKRLYPNSKIVHCLRNPLDVCLSIYFHNFNHNHPYSDNLANLGHYYNQYRALMEFWHQQYEDFIIDIRYEDLLSDAQANVEKLLAHVGLEWQDNCLKFYENKRTVSTPSYAQVTQPMYTTSMERWRNYASHIRELEIAIDDKYL